ncbi:polyprenol monophosphomannose synthase [Corynebacterium pseudodiphtheriticum]|uniref:polyprenol monophosphomannose synthase n=1 Tax=Corynebacterium pseudodiphtheriticum TaxID=37637 RepID=UPI002543115C|nr:polyprenol monophosphomannose synthase [Corynebacterium pseudodiphtheriticum]MDK4243265.1 polyprenol monophosphomannose synthase [Corynebacterium pseudodiphtheriticum]MDK4277635.1 polyprenol monophosphomannose synthase [Corynebacterium pseudodiphtheriticum]
MAESAAPSAKTLVIIPTYNEKENLPRIVGRLRKAQSDVNVLVVDDNSPDGTGELADKLASTDEQVHVLHRAGKGGLCGAYVAGFIWGLERDYQVLCEMDADGSHAPEQLHLLLDAIDNGEDAVIGSRYVPGGKVVNWPKNREWLSRGGNAYISLALGAGLSDMTAGYRAYRREVLEAIDLEELSNAGYIFQVDLARRAIQAGFVIAEVPITFTEREYGESKLDGSFVTDSLAEVTKWGLAHRSKQVKEMSSTLVSFGSHSLRDSALAELPERVSSTASSFSTVLRDLAKQIKK